MELGWLTGSLERPQVKRMKSDRSSDENTCLPSWMANTSIYHTINIIIPVTHALRQRSPSFAATRRHLRGGRQASSASSLPACLPHLSTCQKRCTCLSSRLHELYSVQLSSRSTSTSGLPHTNTCPASQPGTVSRLALVEAVTDRVTAVVVLL